MSEIVIKTHDFEVAKNGLKRFSQNNDSVLELDAVRESGGFLGLGDHKVTGSELNIRLSTIQDHLIDMNKINIDIVKEFGQVYNALEALDSDYIPAILMSIKAAEKANDEVKEAQADIRKILDNQKKTLEILKVFQNKIESYKHISDIDKLWGDFVTVQQNIAKAYDLIQNIRAKVNINTQSIDVLKAFKEGIDSIVHITDVDSIWEDVHRIQETVTSICTDIKTIQQGISLQQQAIQTLLDYKATLEKYSHLKDIDAIWDSLDNTVGKVSEHDDKITEYSNAIDSNKQSIDTLFAFKSAIDEYEHLSDVDTIWNQGIEFKVNLAATKDDVSAQQKQIADIEKTINEIQQNSKERNQLFSRKLKIAYAIAGSSMGIAIVEFILIIFKVI